MIVSSDPRVAYFPPSKTGTTTVEQLFRELDFNIVVGRALKHDIPPADRIAELDEQGYFFMATVRNPYSRCVSMWSHFQKNNNAPAKPHQQQYVLRSEITEVSAAMDFGTWVREVLTDEYYSNRFASYLSNQADYLAAMPRQDAILRQETLTSDLLKLPFIQERKVQSIEAQRIGTYRAKAHWKKLYDDADGVNSVKCRFEPDFDAAGYPTDFERAV